MNLFPGASSATFSPCERYRYTLTRRWDAGAYMLTFLMLNPSTADASKDDPTIRRCIGYARRDGFGGLRVLNIFAFRATDPADMKREADPVGPDNDRTIREVFLHHAKHNLPVVAAWGAHGAHMDREAAVRAMAAEVGVDLMCLGTTDRGHPRHPLYVPAAQPFVRLP